MSSSVSSPPEHGVAPVAYGPTPAPARPRRLGGNRFAVIDVAFAILLFAASFLINLSGVKTTPFHQDESRWLNRAHYIADILDPFGPTWNDQYLTRGQPPIGSYVMGLGLLVQGQSLTTNRAYDFRLSAAWNKAYAMPSTATLYAGRRTSSFLGALAVVLVYLVGRRLTNIIGGLFGALLLMVNPLQEWHNRLALADTTLTFTLAALIFAIYQLARRPRWGWAITVGVLIGIGGANKLTPLVLCGPLALIGIYLLACDWWDRRRLRALPQRSFLGLPSLHHLGWMLLSTPIVAGATFVAVYPYLWPAPIARTWKLIAFRRQENDAQALIYPQFHVKGLGDAFVHTWDRLGRQYSTTASLLRDVHFPHAARTYESLDLWIAFIGLAIMLIVAFRRGIHSPESLIVITLLVQSAIIIVTMKADFERYYLPIVLSCVLVSGFGLGTLIRLIAEGVRALRSPRLKHLVARQPHSEPLGR